MSHTPRFQAPSPEANSATPLASPCGAYTVTSPRPGKSRMRSAFGSCAGGFGLPAASFALPAAPDDLAAAAVAAPLVFAADVAGGDLCTCPLLPAVAGTAGAGAALPAEAARAGVAGTASAAGRLAGTAHAATAMPSRTCGNLRGVADTIELPAWPAPDWRWPQRWCGFRANYRTEPVIWCDAAWLPPNGRRGPAITTTAGFRRPGAAPANRHAVRTTSRSGSRTRRPGRCRVSR